MGATGDNANSVPVAEYESGVLGWLREAVQEGDAFLKRQVGYNKIDATARMIMGQDMGDIRSKDLSQLVDNEFGSIALQLSAALTDVKPFWEYKTYNHSFDTQVDILTKLSYHWWNARHIDQALMSAIKFALAAGSGYLHTIWDPIIQDFVSIAEHPQDVIPVRPLPGSFSIQDCWAVIIRNERTVNELRRRWKSKADLIHADRDGSVVSEDDQNYASKLLSQLNKSPMTRYREFLTKAVANFAGGAMPVADLFTCYVKDYSRNTTGNVVLMGEWDAEGSKPLNNWSYRVNDGDLLYPRGRTIVATTSVVLYDGPSNYWHPQFPISKIMLDPWPFPNGWLGKSPLWDIIDLQKGLNRSQRAIDDHVEHVVGPDLVVDQSTGMSRASVDRIDTRKPRGRFMRRPGPGKGFEYNYPPSLPKEVMERPTILIDRMRSLSGITDISNVMKLAQLPSSDTIEKVMEASTGPVRARSRVLEAFMREFAMQMAYNFTQYYTIRQRIAICGPDGFTIEDFDFDPGNLVPSHIGDDYNRDGSLKPEYMDYTRPRMDRARDFLRYFTYHVTPGSLLKSAKITDQLMYLQLFRAGIMDPWTLMEKLEIPNVGEAPGGARTITDRLAQAMQMGFMGQVSPAGRKSSGQQPPKMKSSGAISESG